MPVWRYAAGPGHALNDSYFEDIFDSPNIQGRRDGVLKASVCNPRGEARVERAALLHTCRLARQIVWEAWREDVNAVGIRERWFLDEWFLRYQEQRRDMVLKVLEDEIECGESPYGDGDYCRLVAARKLEVELLAW